MLSKSLSTLIKILVIKKGMEEAKQPSPFLITNILL